MEKRRYPRPESEITRKTLFAKDHPKGVEPQGGKEGTGKLASERRQEAELLFDMYLSRQKALKLYKDLSKKHSAILLQLRTEKISPKDFLFKQKVSNIAEPRCNCGERQQTIAHILFSCKKFKELRYQELGHLLGRRNLRAVLNKRKTAIDLGSGELWSRERS
jgi:hypothetical protein